MISNGGDDRDSTGTAAGRARMAVAVTVTMPEMAATAATAPIVGRAKIAATAATAERDGSDHRKDSNGNRGTVSNDGNGINGA